MRVTQIYRYPVKGFTPEALDGAQLTPGAGVPFDRICGFTCGNLPDPPVTGEWVPARTFYQLTVYPEVARFTARLNEAARSITITAPNGKSSSAALDDAVSFAGVNALIRSHFEAGPHAVPELHVQAPGHGHWDFTDTALSLINMASVRELAQAAGEEIDPRRFRGNLYLEDLPAWAEFSMIGRRCKIGDAKVEITRQAMRCAATSVDPTTAKTGLNVPAILRKLTGHCFCGVYARVVDGGGISVNDVLEDVGPWDGDPNDNLPPRAPSPAQWPRFVRLAAREHGNVILQNLSENWPLMLGSSGDMVRVHPVSGTPGKMIQLRLMQADVADRLIAADDCSLAEIRDGGWLLISGPYAAAA